MKKITHIICDLSDVLIKGLEGVETPLAEYLNIEEKTIYSQLFSEDFNSLWYANVTEDHFLEKIIQKHSWNISLNHLKHIIRSNFYEIPGVRNIYIELASQYPCFLYSVNTPEWVAYKQAIFQYENIFHSVYYSYMLKSTKREKAGFEYILKTHSLSPESVILIDDSTRNLGIASECGINGICFSNAINLRFQLEKLNLI